MSSLPSLLLLALFAPASFAQTANDATPADQERVVAIETKLNELNDALIQTEKMLEKSRAEIQALHAQLDALRAQTAAASSSAPAQDPQNANTDHPQELEALREQQEAMQAEIKQHDQTKVETFSKYPLRLRRADSVQRIFERGGGRQYPSCPQSHCPVFQGDPMAARARPCSRHC